MNDSDPDPQRHFSAAAEAIVSERRKCQREKTALRQFQRRIRNLSDDARPHTSVHASNHGAGRPTAMTTKTGTAGQHGNPVQRRIRAAYKETVMETDGATELEEVPSEHMAAELGPDISTAVYVSPAPPPHLLTMIDMATTNPISARDNVIRRLDDERSMVNAIGDEVARILDEVKSFECAYPVFTFHELTTYHHRFGELRAQCTALAERRQSAFHSNIAGQNSYFEWTEYLYAECQATHPILAAITEVTEGIDELRKTLSRDIATV